jgi:hypothetical protein
MTAMLAMILGFFPAWLASWFGTLSAEWLTRSPVDSATIGKLATLFAISALAALLNYAVRMNIAMTTERATSLKETREIQNVLEKQAVENAELAHVLIEGVHDYAIIMLSNDGTIQSWNLGAQRIKGWSAEEVIGKPFDIFYPQEEQAVGEPARALAEARRLGTYHCGKGRRIRKDGSIFCADVTITALRNPDGSQRGFAKVTRDITEIVEAEDLVAQNERAAALGQLAAGVAHDFNNVLQVVSGGAAMIQENPSSAEIVSRCADRMIRASARGSAISGRLLAFARRDVLRPDGLNVRSLFDNIFDLLQPLLPSNITVRTMIADELPPVSADQSALETVLVNLATNARDAMPDGGTIMFSARQTSLGIENNLDLLPGRYLCIGVRDTGSGMTPALIARVTEPFFTTKPKGKGTGLGLSMAKRYAEKAGGKLQIESEVGAYTEVTLWLPAALGFAASAPSEHLPLVRPTVTPRVLVVEDDDLVRETMLASMESARINSVEVRSGEDALALLKEGNMFDVLVADFSLPGINGAQMIRDAQQITPNLPALLITGNIGEVLFRGHETPRFGTLRKPFSPAQLIEAITALALREI